MPKAQRPAFLATLLLSVWSSCQGGGCGCTSITPIPDGFDYSNKIENAIHVRLASSGIEFIEQNGPELVDSFTGGLSFTIPCEHPFWPVDVCCCGGVPCESCNADIAINSLNLQAVSPNRLRLDELRVIVETGSMPLDIGFTCDLTLDTTRGSNPDVGLVADLVFEMDSGSGHTHVSFENAGLVDLEGDDIDIDYDFWEVDCAAVDLALLFDFVVDLLASQLSAPIVDAANQFCLPCGGSTTCPDSSDCQDGRCLEEVSGECVQQFGMEGRVDLGELLGSFVPGVDASLDFLAWTGGYTNAENSGLTLGMIGGFEAVEHHPCVPVVPRPTGTIPLSKALAGNTIDLAGGSYAFDIGIGVHELTLNRAGWAAFEAGTLCLDLSSAMPSLGSLLNTQTIGVYLDLSHLTHDRTLPMLLSLRPQQPITFDVGEGLVTYDSSGNPSVESPLLTVNAPDFALDFYALIDERYVRLMRLKTDLALPLALDTDSSGRMVPLLGKSETIFGNLRAENAELLIESTEDIQGMFPALFSLVSGFLTDLLPPIDLPVVQGFVMVDPVFRGVDDNTTLGVFTRLDFVPPSMATAAVETTAQVLEVVAPPPDELKSGKSKATVTVEACGHGPTGAPIEWSYRVDGGLWSLYHRGASTVIDSPLVQLQARHRLEVRAREVGNPKTLDPTPEVLEFVVDSIPPEVQLAFENGSWLVTGTDNVTSAEQLEFAWAREGSEPTDWQVGSLRVGDALDLILYARDEVGNVGRRLAHVRVSEDGGAGGCSCSLGRRSGDGAATLALVLFASFAAALVVLARRVWKDSP